MMERRVSAIFTRCTALLAIITVFNITLTILWKSRYNIVSLEIHQLRLIQATKTTHYSAIEKLNRRDEERKQDLVEQDQISNSSHNQPPIASRVKNYHNSQRYHPCDISTLRCDYDTNVSAIKTSHSDSDSLPPTYIPNRPFTSLSKEDIDGVQKFVFFVGYARSGHSIVASMMDAHPNMVIAHEHRLFQQLSKYKPGTNRSYLYNQLYKNSYNNAVSGWRSETKKQKGYTLAVNNGWQGGFTTKLQVIGDKSGGATSQMYNESPTLFLSILEQLREIVGVPLRVIHVVRNPYDMISTRLLYSDASSINSKQKSKLLATENHKHSNRGGLASQINRTFHMLETVQGILNSSHLTVLDVHLVDFIQNPGWVLDIICTFLGLECPQEYIDSCVARVYKKQSQTRRLVKWPEDLIKDVEQRTNPYPYLWRYSFSGD